MFSLKAKKKDSIFSYRTKRNKANIQVRIMAYRIKKNQVDDSFWQKSSRRTKYFLKNNEKCLNLKASAH